MTRWLAATLATLLLMTAAVGCGQQCFLSKEVYDAAHTESLPPQLNVAEPATAAPITEITAAPPSVDYPDRPARYLSLDEAIAIALENGTVSSRTGAGQGTVDDNLVTFQGAGSLNGQVDRVRVLALNPALASTNLEASLARFDAVYTTALTTSVTDNLQQGLQSFQNGQNTNFTTGISKGLPTGGFVNVAGLVNYQNLNAPPSGQFSILNPQYNTQLIIGFEQPLWKDFGVGINQLLPRFPSINGSTAPQQLATGFNNRQGIVSGIFTNQPVEGILVARLRLDQNRAEFERNIHILVLNTEVAYWNLYRAYGRLYSQENVLRLAHRSWQIYDIKFRAGTISPDVYYPVRAQFEEFRGERTAALGEVLERERNLRGIMGLPVEDGNRLVPATPPTLAPYQPDWGAAVRDALALRPELVLARENVRFHEYNLEIQKNLLKPDLRAFAQYNPVGFGNRLDGTDTFTDGTGTLRTTNALRSLAGNSFNNFNLGLTFNMPIGFRFENAATRGARLTLAQSVALLKAEEETAQRVLALQYQKISETHRLIEARRSERIAYQEAVKTRLQTILAGVKSGGELDYLDAQRRFGAALIKEYESIAEYNNSLARFEWTKGTILKYNNVHISEGSLPQCAQVRAVEHEKERTQARILRERPDPLTLPGRVSVGVPPDLPPVNAAGSSPNPFQEANGTLPPTAPVETGPQPRPLTTTPGANPSAEPSPEEKKGLSAPPPLPEASHSPPGQQPLVQPLSGTMEMLPPTAAPALPPVSVPDTSALPSVEPYFRPTPSGGAVAPFRASEPPSN